MSIIREPDGVDLFVEARPMTREEADEVAAWISAHRDAPEQRAAAKEAREIVRRRSEVSSPVRSSRG